MCVHEQSNFARAPACVSYPLASPGGRFIIRPEPSRPIDALRLRFLLVLHSPILAIQAGYIGLILALRRLLLIQGAVTLSGHAVSRHVGDCPSTASKRLSVMRLT
jgi:hypothetical protein